MALINYSLLHSRSSVDWHCTSWYACNSRHPWNYVLEIKGRPPDHQYSTVWRGFMV